MHFNVILMMLLLLFASPVHAIEIETVHKYNYCIEIICVEGHVFWYGDKIHQLMTQSKDGSRTVPMMCDNDTFKNKTIVFYRHKKKVLANEY